MKTHEYRGYVIKVEAIQTWSSKYWEGRAYIGSFQSVPLYGPFNTFTTEEEAERHILAEAQKWVDEQIRSTEN